MRNIHEAVRQEVTQVMVAAAETNELSIHADALAVASEQDMSIVSAPVAGLEEVDFKHMLERGPVLKDTPIMVWYLAGEVLRDKAFPFSEGFYTVVADQRSGTVTLRDAKGTIVARGELEVSIDPPAPQATIAARISLFGVSISGSVTRFDVNINKKRINICGNVSAGVGGATVTVEGCIEVTW